MAEDLLLRILAEAGLSAPDGRLLHAYGLSDPHFAEIARALRGLAPRRRRGQAVAALYVLWASEHIRRRYDGSGLSWEFINTDVPQMFDGTTIAGFVRSGLDVWLRPLRRGRGGNRLFMYTLLAEGGIPLAVLESAGRHTQVLRDMIDAICSRGGIAGLGYETAFDMAHQKMRYLPNILKDLDSVALFLDLAQAIHDLREALPPGLEGGQRQDWLDRERPGWQRSLPLRVTPQIIENIIRPSLTVAHPVLRPRSHPAVREIHLTETGAAVLVAVPVAVLAPQASLPVLALPQDEASLLRLVPRFATRRPFAYRALRAAEGGVRDLERLGGSGPEVVPLGLGETLDFDVMADSQSLGVWSALPGLPSPVEAPSLWAGQGADGLRLRQMSGGGRTRASSLWVTLPEGAAPGLDVGLVALRRIKIAGASLLEVQGQGLLTLGDHTLRIATEADSDSEPAALHFFGRTLPIWRTTGGEPVYLGHPTVYGQKGNAALVALRGAQLRRATRPGSLFGAEFHEWWIEGERIAAARALFLPAELRVEMKETPDGGLSVLVSGLPEGLLADLRAGALSAHAPAGAGPLVLGTVHLARCRGEGDLLARCRLGRVLVGVSGGNAGCRGPRPSGKRGAGADPRGHRGRRGDGAQCDAGAAGAVAVDAARYGRACCPSADRDRVDRACRARCAVRGAAAAAPARRSGRGDPDDRKVRPKPAARNRGPAARASGDAGHGFPAHGADDHRGRSGDCRGGPWPWQPAER